MVERDNKMSKEKKSGCERVRESWRAKDSEGRSGRGRARFSFLPIWLPKEARESTATMMPPWNLKARVVVPCWIRMRCCAEASVCARRKSVG